MTIPEHSTVLERLVAAVRSNDASAVHAAAEAVAQVWGTIPSRLTLEVCTADTVRALKRAGLPYYQGRPLVRAIQKRAAHLAYRRSVGLPV